LKVTFVSSGLEHLGVSALSAWVRTRGHEPTLVYEPQPFSSNSGPDNRLLAKLFEPRPAQTAEKVLATSPDCVAFSSYTITHRWAVEVAREIKRRAAVPIVFGGPHVSGSPEDAIREPAIDAVVEGEGEGALSDLLECVENGRFARTDIPNTWLKGTRSPIRNPLRPLISDLDALPFPDKRIFYDQVPAFEREYYAISRRGCPYRCSFCEYSIFPKQYPGEKPVRRRSVGNLIAELKLWKARGKMRKVFFWDAIFTLDITWMEEFAEAYRREIGIPFECYTHPSTMTREMARQLSRAGCALVRVGVQSVNADTLVGMDRRGHRDRVAETLNFLREFAIPYSLDHILGLPGEGPEDQREAIRFYNQVRPARIVLHWMTYFPGTTALERAERQGLLSADEVRRIRRGEVTEGYEVPRLVGRQEDRSCLQEIERLAVLFDLMGLLPPRTINWLLSSGLYRVIPRGFALRQLIALVRTMVGDSATRERMQMILAAAFQAARKQLFRDGRRPRVTFR
jgi:anaerobic magnesium-protoporphyrin IX monomethyl ester cyclase